MLLIITTCIAAGTDRATILPNLINLTGMQFYCTENLYPLPCGVLEGQRQDLNSRVLFQTNRASSKWKKTHNILAGTFAVT